MIPDIFLIQHTISDGEAGNGSRTGTIVGTDALDAANG
jgi:hypothetical protein